MHKMIPITLDSFQGLWLSLQAISPSVSSSQTERPFNNKYFLPWRHLLCQKVTLQESVDTISNPWVISTDFILFSTFFHLNSQITQSHSELISPLTLLPITYSYFKNFEPRAVFNTSFESATVFHKESVEGSNAEQRYSGFAEHKHLKNIFRLL